jgi:peptidyl-prolyl cis-trans isomerase C
MSLSHPWVAVTTCALALVVAPLASVADDPADVVVTINGEAVPRAELDRSIAAVLEGLDGAGPLDPDQQALLEETAKENLIRTELLYQLARKDPVADLDQRVNEQYNQIREGLADDAEWQEALAAQGLTEDGLREQLRRAVLIDAFIEDQVASKIEITEAQARSFYDQYPEAFQMPESMRASHILIGVEPGEPADARDGAKQKANELLVQVRSGADFADLAKAESTCPSAEQGGDLGDFQRGQMVAPFEEAAFALEPGEVSEVVESPFGYHIIKATGRSPAEVIPFEEVEERIVSQLKMREIQQQVLAKVDAFRQTSEIIMPEAQP